MPSEKHIPATQLDSLINQLSEWLCSIEHLDIQEFILCHSERLKAIEPEIEIFLVSKWLSWNNPSVAREIRGLWAKLTRHAWGMEGETRVSDKVDQKDIMITALKAANDLLVKLQEMAKTLQDYEIKLVTGKSNDSRSTINSTAEDEYADSNHIIVPIDVDSIRDSNSKLLLVDLINSPNGVEYNPEYYGKRQPVRLRDMLRRNGFEKIAIHIKKKQGKIFFDEKLKK